MGCPILTNLLGLHLWISGKFHTLYFKKCVESCGLLSLKSKKETISIKLKHKIDYDRTIVIINNSLLNKILSHFCFILFTQEENFLI